MEFDWLHDAAGWISDLEWNWPTATITAGGVLAGKWLLDRANVFTSKRTDEWLEARWNRLKSNRAQRRQDKAKTKAAEELKERLRVLEAERVGRRFLRREKKDDPGQLMKVVGLDTKYPERRVRIQPVGPDRFAPVTVIDWKHLTSPAQEQKRLTARFVLRSENPDDGWLTYEQVPD